MKTLRRLSLRTVALTALRGAYHRTKMLCAPICENGTSVVQVNNG